MNQKDISNLKRQITRRSLRGVEKEMHYLQACRCHFDCETVEGIGRNGTRYYLLASGSRVGEFTHEFSGQQPSFVLRRAWVMAGVSRPWEEDQENLTL